jgi:hypothetical protein
MTDLRETLQNIRQVVTNWQPQNRYGVVVKVRVMSEKPNLCRVLIDRGARDFEKHDTYRELCNAILPTAKVLREHWASQDLLAVGWLGIFTKIASYQELLMIGADVEKIYAPFGNWIGFHHDLDELRQIHAQ